MATVTNIQHKLPQRAKEAVEALTRKLGDSVLNCPNCDYPTPRIGPKHRNWVTEIARLSAENDATIHAIIPVLILTCLTCGHIGFYSLPILEG